MRATGQRSELLAAVRRGTLIPITRGVFRYKDYLESDPVKMSDDRYLALVRGSHLLAASAHFRGFAAAVVWGLPNVVPWPSTVQVATPHASGGRSNAVFQRSFAGLPLPIVEFDGLTVSSLSRTVVDVGRIGSLQQSLAAADAALGGRNRAGLLLPHGDLIAERDRYGKGRGIVKCSTALSLADGGSGSAGESASRASIFLAGLSSPELQTAFYDAEGLIGYVDFFWPESRIIGEFDGLGKYLREEYARGRSIADIVIAEKRREDRLRALGYIVVRWGWNAAMSPEKLRTLLMRAGVR